MKVLKLLKMCCCLLADGTEKAPEKDVIEWTQKIK
jgi:hypothetical protein